MSFDAEGSPLHESQHAQDQHKIAQLEVALAVLRDRGGSRGSQGGYMRAASMGMYTMWDPCTPSSPLSVVLSQSRPG